MKKIAGFFLFISFFYFNSFCQESESDLREAFMAAESYFLFEEYNEALPLYLRLHRSYPENDNYNYKIGVCYLNNPYEKDKSIYYLEKAIDNINPKYRENSFKESSAPLEALFYLGNAYRINNNLKKAREFYNRFLKQVDPDVFNTDIIKEQLAVCDAAENLMRKPVDIDVTNVDEPVNTRFADTNPVLSGDETRMAYVSKLQFYDAVFYTEKKEGKWSEPRNIIPELGVDKDAYPTCMSYDGTEMYVYRNDDFAGNIYYTRLVNDRWTPLVKLNDNINTKYWESHASLSRDGKTLYFTSNRKGTYGGLDIYFSRKQANNDWGPAINLGRGINTRYNEDTPFVTEDGNTIYFSSQGHYNMGGYDIFMSRKITDTAWAKPVNLGYPINTTDDDFFFLPLKNGQIAYYSAYKETGFGRHDIYRYLIYSPDFPRKYRITGRVDYAGLTPSGRDVNLSVVDNQKRDTVARTNPDNSGNFSFDLPAGKFEMIIDSKVFEKTTQSLTIGSSTPKTGITMSSDIVLKPIPPPLTPEEIEKLLEVQDTLIRVKKDSPVHIKYSAEKGSEIVIRLSNNSSFISSDTIINNQDKRLTYTFIPKPGINEIAITLKDKNGNIVSKIAKVIYDTETTKSYISVIVPEEPDKTSGLIENYRNQLARKSEGNLRKFLENINTDSLGINTPLELTQYLHSNAGRFGFSAEGVDSLIKSGSDSEIKNAEKLRNLLSGITSGNLKGFLDTMNLRNHQITSGEDLIRFLRDNSSRFGFSEADINAAFLNLAYHGSFNAIIDKMINNSSGNLHKSLIKIKAEKAGITSYDELVRHLYDNADKYGYSREDVDLLLGKIANRESLQDFLLRLRQKSSGPLREFLDTLDLGKNGIKSVEDLLSFLRKHADSSGFSDNIMQDILLNLGMDEPRRLVIPSEDANKKASGSGIMIFSAVLIVFIIFFLWFFRKKKKRTH